METLFTLICVQAFMWALLLLKKKNRASSWLALAFVSILILFGFRYANFVFETEITHSLVLGTAVVGFFFISTFLFHILSFGKTPKILLFSNFLYAALSSGILFLFEIDQPVLQTFALLIPLSALMIIQVIFLLKKIRLLTHSGTIFKEERYRFSVVYIMLTLYVIIAGAIVCEFIIDLNPLTAKAVFAFDILFAVLLFISGFISHSGKFVYVEPNKASDSTPADEWVKKVNDLMENEKPWLDCELTLGGMAEMLGLVEFELTQILNQKMKTNFYSLVNNYRVETVKEKLKDPENRQFTILAAAYESGFNSKSTFYRIFKEHTGQTPKQFMDGLG